MSTFTLYQRHRVATQVLQNLDTRKEAREHTLIGLEKLLGNLEGVASLLVLLGKMSWSDIWGRDDDLGHQLPPTGQHTGFSDAGRKMLLHSQ